MTELDMLSIIRHGQAYQVRYASSNPYDLERQSYTCPDEEALLIFLQSCELDSWSVQHALAVLRKGHMAVLPLVRSAAQAGGYFA